MSAKNKWLIKSDSKILGPYSYEQVEDLILKKQISLIDEIRDMEMRWSYVREVPEFKNFVESVRTSGDQKSDITQTIQTALQKTTTKGGATSTDANMNFSEVDIAPSVPVQVEQAPRQQNRVAYVKPEDTPLEVRRNTALKISIIFAVFLGLVGTIWYYVNNSEQSRSEKNLFQLIRMYNLYGQDERSLEAFKKLPQSTHEKMLVDIIPLWPKLEAVGAIHPEQILDLVTTDKLEGNERNSQYQLFKVYKAYNLGDTQNAQDALVKAIDLDPSSQDVKENNALFSFYQKKYAISSKIFKELYDQYGHGRYLYGHVLSQIKNNNVDSAQTLKAIDGHIQKRVDFSKELMLLHLYLSKKNQTSELYYEQFVQFPHAFSKYFKINNLIISDLYHWDNLKNIMDEYTKGLSTDKKIMMNINFLLEKGQYEVAFETYKKHQTLFDSKDQINLEIALNYFNKYYNYALESTVDISTLHLSSKLYLLLMHISDRPTAIDTQYAQSLQQEKALFANWAQLMLLKLPRDKSQIRSIVNKDAVHGHDFLPYLEVKALLNE